ncbi:MBOAT family protein [Rhizobium sp. Root1220]|uniref:MBOAT family O-acyltransferase n=1 Tax=Rhizobium sp. Root1220 TaxID=1736432 RepID=UPI0006F7496C|nr:MBOAT family protein [Rhizobium sp. Root1220]KQV70460.1 poly(beta-D-mannuronate) O-acetylase [Rhizobium sp. Root1220]
MVFSSEVFLFLFLPVFLLVYYLTPMAARSVTILVGSYAFYGWWRMDFLALLFATTVWVYVFAILVERNLGSRYAKVFLTVGIAGCLSVLGVFKYLNFFIDSFAQLMGTNAEGLGVHWRLILPIGISFYVFQSISYLVDVYRRDTPATRNFINLAAYKALFPQLIAGPILRFRDLAGQFQSRQHTLEKFTDGTSLFVIGLAKKVLLADPIAPIANTVFASAHPTMIEAWLGAIAYTMQLYFDFSGYSDMAIGLGLMIGFRFAPNFDTPYVSRSITEFWRRWHISLSSWLRDYIYIPLGGSRLGSARTYLNLIFVMLLGGLWHGANWTFVLWGGWHGGWLALERASGWSRIADTKRIALPMTLLVVLLGWVMFRAGSVNDAFAIYGGMLGQNGVAVRPDILLDITHEAILTLVVACFVVAIEPMLGSYRKVNIETPAGDGAAVLRQPLAMPLLLSLLATVTILRLAETSQTPFLYFQF